MEATEKLSKTEILISIIDDCVSVDQRRRNSFMLEYNGEKPLPSEIDPAVKLRATLETINPDIDAIEFIWSLMTLRSHGVFHNIHEAEEAKRGFEGYGFELTRIIEIAIQEAELRNSAIQSFIAEKEYKWDKKKSSSFTDKIELDIKTYTYDHGSKLEYLKTLHSEKIKEIKDLKKTALEKAGYYFNSFYTGDEYTFTDEQWLNLYFYELQSNHAFTYLDARRLLIEYIEKRNEAKFFRELIAKETDVSDKSIDLEYITDEIKLIKAHSYFVDKWGLTMSGTDFKRLFCLDTEPAILPELKHGGQQPFCYFLSLLKNQGLMDLTDKQYKKRFGFSYKSVMLRVNEKALKLITRREIDRILNPSKEIQLK